MIRSMKGKGLVLALTLAVGGCLLPFNMDKVDAATASTSTSTSSTQVKAKTYSKKDGRYSVNVKQAKVDYKTVNVYIPGIKTLKKVKGTKKVYKVKVTAYMYCDKQVTKQKSKTVKLSSISSSKKYFTMSAPAMGKYNFVVKYYNKRGKTVRTVTVKNAGVIAQEYNIATLNATYGPLQFSMCLWDITKGEKGNPIPTTIAVTRKGTYNWSKMPPNVQLNPKMKDPLSTNSLVKMSKYMQKYVQDLRSLNKNSKFHFYLTDTYVNGILELACKNKLPENRYDVTFLSDGSSSYIFFNRLYGGANAQRVYDTTVAEWKLVKKAWKQGNYIDPGIVTYPSTNTTYSLRNYTYAVVGSSSNVRWWVGRKDGTFESKDTAFLEKAKSRIEQFNMNDKLNELKEKNHQNAFKAWYHFSDSMFADATKKNKKVMLLMGGRVTSEKDFAEFTAFVKKYYGSKYEYYYKGHPGTPTDMYPEKKKQLAAAGVHDVDSTIPAELILFFYPDVYVSGMSNSTLNTSYKNGRTCAYLGVRKDKALAKDDKGNMGVIDGNKFQLFFTNLEDSEVKAGKYGELTIPSGDKCYLVEFNNHSKYDYAIYDYTKNKIIYHEIKSSTATTATTEAATTTTTTETATTATLAE